MPPGKRSTGPRRTSTRRTHPDPLDRDPRPALALRCVHGPGPAAPVALVAGTLRIGRVADAGVDVVVPDPAVSSVHAVVSCGHGRVEIVDHDSSNGVFLDGARVGRAELREGDVLRLGDTVFVVARAATAAAHDGIGLVGTSAVLAELREAVRRVAPSRVPVIVAGPTGTGKELVARALHDASGRRGAFVPVNCAALPATLVESVLFGHRRGAFTGATADFDGAFVQAHGGTLLLDEVGEMPLDAQAKLLRAIETSEVVPIGAGRAIPVDVRIVAATSVDFDASLRAQRFRADLYARLAGVVLRTPRLVEHREDVLPLFRHFAAQAGAPSGARPMTADFAECLCVQDWPLNVRELRQLVDRLCALHGDATHWELAVLDEKTRARRDGAPVDAVEAAAGPPSREELVALLARCGGNVSLVARRVGRSRKQVYRWLEQHALTPRGGDAPE